MATEKAPATRPRRVWFAYPLSILILLLEPPTVLAERLVLIVPPEVIVEPPDRPPTAVARLADGGLITLLQEGARESERDLAKYVEPDVKIRVLVDPGSFYEDFLNRWQATVQSLARASQADLVIWGQITISLNRNTMELVLRGYDATGKGTGAASGRGFPLISLDELGLLEELISEAIFEVVNEYWPMRGSSSRRKEPSPYDIGPVEMVRAAPRTVFSVSRDFVENREKFRVLVKIDLPEGIREPLWVFCEYDGVRKRLARGDKEQGIWGRYFFPAGGGTMSVYLDFSSAKSSRCVLDIALLDTKRRIQAMRRKIEFISPLNK